MVFWSDSESAHCCNFPMLLQVLYMCWWGYGHGFFRTGFKCCSRKRQWHLAVHKDWGQFVEEPADMYAQLVESLTCLQVDISQAFWMTDPKELLTEKKLVKKRCKKDDSLLLGCRYCRYVSSTKVFGATTVLCDILCHVTVLTTTVTLYVAHCA